MKICSTLTLMVSLATSIWCQQPLQIHFMDVGQGDGAILISPGGQIVAFDLGEDLVKRTCDKPLAYLEQLGIDHIDYLILSHYHQDHLGCVPEVLEKYPLQKQAFDRGLKYNSTYYTAYVAAVGDKRTTARVGPHVLLDNGAVDIEILALNAAGKGTPVKKTSNENDLSVSARVSFGGFRAEIGGDLSGEAEDGYRDIESGLAKNVGRLDIYKVHHHCSSYSSNDNWLATTKPTVAIISDGDGNSYGHPAADCLERLHASGVHLYLTEKGDAAELDPTDIVAQNIIVNVSASGLTVQHGTEIDKYCFASSNGDPGALTAPDSPVHPTFAWITHSKYYHFINCIYVASIQPDNLQSGVGPPAGKTLHPGCLRHAKP
jgi:competence protein ComEC